MTFGEGLLLAGFIATSIQVGVAVHNMGRLDKLTARLSDVETCIAADASPSACADTFVPALTSLDERTLNFKERSEWVNSLLAAMNGELTMIRGQLFDIKQRLATKRKSVATSGPAEK